MNAADVLSEARTVLLEGGWMQGTSGPVTDRTCAHCLFGAIATASWELCEKHGYRDLSIESELRVERFVIEALTEHGLLVTLPPDDINARSHFGLITTSNDRLVQSKEQAIAVLDTAVRLATAAERRDELIGSIR